MLDTEISEWNKESSKEPHIYGQLTEKEESFQHMEVIHSDINTKGKKKKKKDLKP